MRGHDRESQSGVPFPGVKLPRDRWSRTRTGLGAPGTVLDWDAVFGRTAKRVLDLGCGNGRFLIGSAIARPECDHVGIELVPQAVKFASLRAGQRGLTNVKIAWGDASEFVLERCAPGSIDEIHLYHPQPYYEAGQKARRQLTPAILRAIHRALVPGGRFVFQTDNAAFARYAREIVPLLFTWVERKGPWPDAPEGRTLREITARRLGLSIVRAEATRLDLDDAEVEARVARMPEPDFDANRPAFRDDDDADDGYAGQAGIFRGRTRSRVTGTSGGDRSHGGHGGRGGRRGQGQGGAGGGAGPQRGPGSGPGAGPGASAATGRVGAARPAGAPALEGGAVKSGAAPESKPVGVPTRAATPGSETLPRPTVAPTPVVAPKPTIAPKGKVAPKSPAPPRSPAPPKGKVAPPGKAAPKPKAERKATVAPKPADATKQKGGAGPARGRRGPRTL